MQGRLIIEGFEQIIDMTNANVVRFEIHRVLILSIYLISMLYMSNSSKIHYSKKPTIEKSVPQSRIARISKLGGLVASITGNVVKNSITSLAKNEKPNINGTLLNVNNAQSIAKHLSHMRGAAMKVGQMLSMDAGEILPAEWEPVLSMLREQAYAMPKTQLITMLVRNLGENWADNFTFFSFEPIAAASIGQVHRATLKSGEEVAVKVQYPGVARTIDSDIDNLASILTMSRLVPAEFDLASLLQQAKAQLKLEADYLNELRCLKQYSAKLGDDPRFLVPKVFEQISTTEILCMEFVEATPIANLANEGGPLKRLITKHLFDLLFQELFANRLIQSDPNFANYMYQKQSQRLVLLDFGACKDISEHVQIGYKNMASAMQNLDEKQLLTSLLELGLLNVDSPEHIKNTVIQACLMAAECLQANQYNFKQAEIVKRLQHLTQGLVTDTDAIASPDFEVALVNRKVTGVVLLANKMDVVVPLKGLLSKYIQL